MRERLSQRTVDLGSGRIAHASGAMWLPAESTVVIADVHLGYAWAMRRRRQLGPVAEGGVREKIRGVLRELQPRRVVLLGDVVHAARPHAAERALVEDTLREIAAGAELIVVRGNHDRLFAQDYGSLGLDTRDCWESDGVVAMHGDKPVPVSNKHVMIGHVHPALGVVDDAGASQRIPVFLVSENCTVLPAFSPFAAGFVIGPRLPDPLGSMFCTGEVEVVAASGKRAVRVGPLSRMRW
ncbi:MAG TPA: metallophosphoesterase [Bryobacteraceae bacterium]|nr:metallophosphoesterase [Bryobacteraceae bacterium]